MAEMHFATSERDIYIIIYTYTHFSDNPQKDLQCKMTKLTY